MGNPFAAIESTVNAAVIGALSNVVATVAGASVSGIFDNGSAQAFALVGGTRPTFIALADDIPDAAIGDAVVISSIAYTISDLQPDGVGMMRVVLEKS